MKNTQNKGFYDFAGFRLDAQNRLLWREGKTVSLTLKEFEVLLFLVENAERVVEKEDLLETIWGDTFVEEATLARNISRLRKKLEAAGNSETIIETLPKRGYRLLPDVTRVEVPQTALLAEEETIQQIRIEETMTISDVGFPITDFEAAKPDARQLNPKSEIRSPKMLGLAFGALAIAIIGFLAYQLYFRKPEPKNVLPAKVVPFSGSTGNEDMPAFSPDGRQMAFAWNGGEGEQLDVYVKLIGAGEPVRLTNSAEDEVYPVFSPDSRQIAFVRSLPEGDEVILIPAMGGAERRISSLNSRQTSVSFSPDGQNLAVVESGSNNQERGIFLVNINTGERRKLTAPTGFAADTTPRFSPGGANLAFLRSFDDLKQEIFVVPVTGGEARQLTFDNTGIRSLAWSADGEKIFFVSFRSTEQPNLWQIIAAGGEPALIATGSKNMTNIAVSPDGKTVAFAEAARDENIWQMKLGESWRKFAASARPDHSPHVSPDGKRVVFASDRTGHQEIWIADADGKNQRQLTYSSGNAGSPRFSPDGNFVAYDSQSGTANDIFIISSEGGAPRRLTDSPDSRNVLPSWSADGQFVYFRSNRSGDFNLWKMPVNGGAAIQITKQGAFESFASPDGKEIYYTKGRGIAGLWLGAAEGSDESPVPELAEAGYWRSWNVTTKGIYFVARSSAPPYRIMFYDFANKQSREIAQTEKAPLWIFSSLSVSEDGKTIFYAQQDQSASSILLAELAK